MNGRFPVALHILTLLCTTREDVLSSDVIADSVNANRVLVRKELSNLIKHGLVISREGKSGGYCLSRPAKNINIASIYDAVKSPAVLGQARNRPNPNCQIGKQMDSRIQSLYCNIDSAIGLALQAVTLADFCKDLTT